MKAYGYLTNDGTFVPASESDAEKARKMSGDGVELTAKYYRNLKNHRRFFSMINVLSEHTDFFQSDSPTLDTLKERWLEYLLIGAGHCDTFITPSGELHRVRKSIAFSEMEEDEFRKLFNSCVSTALRIVPEELAPMLNTF